MHNHFYHFSQILEFCLFNMDKDCLRLCLIWGLKQHTHKGENNTNGCGMLCHRGGRIDLDINNSDTNIGFGIGMIPASQFQPLQHPIVASLPHFIKEHTRPRKHRPFHMRHTLRLLLPGSALLLSHDTTKQTAAVREPCFASL